MISLRARDGRAPSTCSNYRWSAGPIYTQRLKSLIDAYGEDAGRRPWRRFVIHSTPKHGNWLNPAEIEVSLRSRECVGRDRIATLCELQ
jgi:hypothetical protein